MRPTAPDPHNGTMEMNEYQKQATTTAIYPEAGSGSVGALSYLGLGLGEVGEVQGKIKKIIRDNGGVVDEVARLDIAKELGDVLWYVALLADEIDMSLHTVGVLNLNKLADRRDRDVLVGSGDER